MILLDSSVFIAGERGKFDLPAFLEKHAKDEFAISAITASELLHGVYRATGKTRAHRSAFVEQLISQLLVIPFDLIAARIHAGLWADLASKGTPVGAHDLLIAATAIALNAKVATLDMRSFPKIAGLETLAGL